ncbi:hypothetical protein Mapa_003119 [Marchantia paleacea]|nr:hypothetical protein Mapa_003119 [Marchantia paleacea]
MDKKPLIIPGDNRLESSQNLHHSVLVGAAHEMFQSGHGLGTSSNMTPGAMCSLHPPLSSFGAESNLHELLAHASPHAGSHAQSLNHSSNHPADFLATLGDGVLGESSDNHMFHRQMEYSKQKWATPSKLTPGPFWMLPHHLDPANYPLPGLAVSGTSSPKTNVGPSAGEDSSNPNRQVWCERGANQVLMKSEDNVATLKLPMVVKPDRSLLCDGSGAPVDSPKGANGSLNNRDNSDMDAKQLDSSDCSDHNMDEQEEKDQATRNGAGRTVSKNLVSERKRRKKLNDGLYTLRALVPKISKMDKASIVGDAIDYVRELQKQVEELQADISDIESTKPTTGPGGEESLSSVVEPSAAQGSTAPSSGRSWEEDGHRTCEGKPRQEMSEGPFEDTTEQKILELDVAKMEEQIYHLRIFCTKGPGVFVQLMQSLEALGLEIRNANLTSFQENLLNTFIAEIKDWEMMKTEEVKKAILDVAARFGLQP